ncbi:MAG: MmcQ/YjbR family DNA-binding protein [Candidatus Velthaea sp.]
MPLRARRSRVQRARTACSMATWEHVRRYALALPEVCEQTSHGRPAWAVNGRTFAWERPLRASDMRALGDAAPDGPILGMRTADLEMKEAVLQSDPLVFFTIPHFDGYAAVLVQLRKIGARVLKRLLEDAWLARAPERAARAYLHAKSKT